MKYLRIDTNNVDSLMGSLVECYRQVFAAEPWSEWMRCHHCHEHWGIHQHAQREANGHQCCESPEVKEFWPREEVEKDLRSQLDRPGATIWVAVEEEMVVGFCMGYLLPVETFDEHLELEGVISSFEQSFGNHDASVVYLDDIGVLVSHQGQKIGNELLKHWFDAIAGETSATHSILRTQTEPPTVAHAWYKKIGFEDIAHYRDHKERVIMAAPLSVILKERQAA